MRLLWGSEPRGRITVAEGRCTIGSACTITRIKESAQALRELIPGLDGDPDLMASHPIRNMGTLGGNLANAPLGDLTVIFMALDADLRLSGPDGERVVRLKDFYTGYKKTRLAPAEYDPNRRVRPAVRRLPVQLREDQQARAPGHGHGQFRHARGARPGGHPAGFLRRAAWGHRS